MSGGLLVVVFGGGRVFGMVLGRAWERGVDIE